MHEVCDNLNVTNNVNKEYDLGEDKYLRKKLLGVECKILTNISGMLPLYKR